MVLRVIFILIPCWILLSTAVKDNTESKCALEVKKYFQLQLELFQQKVRKLQALEQKDVPEAALQKDFLEARVAFKRAEFLLNYLESNEVHRFNGPNLVTNEYDSRAPREIQPHGLQVIEALIYNPTTESRAELRKEIALLETLATTFTDRNQDRKMGDVAEFNIVIWDAMRYEVYRIESLGITGFDVPDSENSLPESAAALESLRKVIAIYKPVFVNKNLKEPHSQGMKHLKLAIKYLKENNDFKTFNRLAFMDEHLHPISAWLTKSVGQLGFVYPSDVRPLESGAEHLFSENIFNPAYFSPNVNAQKIALGQKLFSDPVLSQNGTRSCASCHIPSKAFADGLPQSYAMNGTDLLARNTPSLWNVGWQTKQFYDSRVTKLEKQSLDVIHNAQEMGGNLILSVEKIKANEAYAALFKDAYSGVISEATVVHAISSYIRSLQSFDSRFDRYLRGNHSTLTASEINGFNLFAGKAKCATCHFAPLFNGLVAPKYTETESEIIGVPKNKSVPSVIDPDLGKYNHTQLEIHRYSFKTPGLRNVALTAPYMHNGVFSTLEEVLDFYNNGGGAGQGMDLPSQTLAADSLHLTKQEQTEIILFLKALTSEL